MMEMSEYWTKLLSDEKEQPIWWERKQELWEREKGSIVKVEGRGEPFQNIRYDDKTNEDHLLHLRFLIKQEGRYHLEEQVLHYRLERKNGEIINYKEILPEIPNRKTPSIQVKEAEESGRQDFVYDRREAVRYAERWWNSYNPAFRVFDDDCTNYISQCLYAGGAPMRGAPQRDRGWWYQGNNWSYSWSVAHSLRWYLSGSTVGLRGRELENPQDLMLGDVICYDFEGDGRWDHNTIVVNKDFYGMPLVNAHTNNSRNRYWTYEDSAAWTPNIQYKFFRIGE
ncbi:amidase domain-containing protein [Oceanobacillus luteolus]|uniref:Amidase domain-containing protein n=1 Tax=Oceanobacillus luteolus TaxID=1274358 RepID=A0ABW4HRA7_9BACI|nr:amidase domain-containing protein [Oceanobacillus luteolus]MCM3739616.1 amidase domain-containing protein [Oceanobacillus luteolus]